MPEPVEPSRRVRPDQVRTRLLREVEERERVTPLAVRPLAGPVEPLTGELAQQGVALEPRLAVVGRLDLDQALVRQRLEAVDDEHLERRVRVHDVLGDLGAPAAGEDRTPPEDRLLVGRQEVVAPGDRTTQRPLALRQIAGAAGQDVQALLEPFEDRRRREHPDPGGGELDGEGQALESVARWLGRPRARHRCRRRRDGPGEPGRGTASRRQPDRAAGPRTRVHRRPGAARGS